VKLSDSNLHPIENSLGELTSAVNYRTPRTIDTAKSVSYVAPPVNGVIREYMGK
jgi:hypothetical protein